VRLVCVSKAMLNVYQLIGGDFCAGRDEALQVILVDWNVWIDLFRM
jgi:hypothetical protein